MAKGRKKAASRWWDDWTLLWVFGGFILAYFVYIPVTGDRVHPEHWIYSSGGGVAAYGIERLVAAARLARSHLRITGLKRNRKTEVRGKR